ERELEDQGDVRRRAEARADAAPDHADRAAIRPRALVRRARRAGACGGGEGEQFGVAAGRGRRLSRRIAPRRAVRLPWEAAGCRACRTEVLAVAVPQDR